MNSSSLLRPSPPPLLFHRNRFVISSSSRNQSYIPKLEPFSRSKIDRVAKSLPIIEKSEKDLSGTFPPPLLFFFSCLFSSFDFKILIYTFNFVLQIIVLHLKVMNVIVAGRLILSLKIFKYVFSSTLIHHFYFFIC